MEAWWSWAACRCNVWHRKLSSFRACRLETNRTELKSWRLNKQDDILQMFWNVLKRKRLHFYSNFTEIGSYNWWKGYIDWMAECWTSSRPLSESEMTKVPYKLFHTYCISCFTQSTGPRMFSNIAVITLTKLAYCIRMIQICKQQKHK